MRAPTLRLLLLACIGSLAPIWWSWSVSQLTYALYLASDSFTEPTKTFAVASLLAPTIGLGTLTGAVIFLLSSQRIFLAWLVFWLSYLVAIGCLAYIYAGTLSSLLNVFRSPYNFAFLVVSAWPVLWSRVVNYKRIKF